MCADTAIRELPGWYGGLLTDHALALLVAALVRFPSAPRPRSTDGQFDLGLSRYPGGRGGPRCRARGRLWS
jgi:hypothetical protein